MVHSFMENQYDQHISKPQSALPEILLQSATVQYSVSIYFSLNFKNTTQSVEEHNKRSDTT